ncbi:MAG: Alkaline phosphatase synthesis transcriptional regulatory protein PhoP [Verrucomicrobiae bacterium]|nr:Alkaline phosphatase synthesis transcriptional regulatory protein PhoP [Verrucomicrobiae bacterium]
MKERPLIVVAEDESDAAQLLDFHLRRSGYAPVLAADGLAALNEAFARKPALILLDLMMPKLDGFQVCRMLKSSPITQHIPVMMITAMGTPEDKLRGFGHGADDYVTKPFAIPELLARIQSLLARPRPFSHHDYSHTER